MEILAINSNRRFRYHGRTYMIQNLPTADIEGNKKYYIAILEDGLWYVGYATRWQMPKFATIKDARRYVRDWDFILMTM